MARIRSRIPSIPSRRSFRSSLALAAFAAAVAGLVAFGASAPASADAGPKPSLVVRVVGGPSASSYYLDLLVPLGSNGTREGPGGYARDNALVQEQPIYGYSEGGRVAFLCHAAMAFGDLEGKTVPDGTVLHSFGYLFVPHSFAVIVQDRATGALTVSNAVTTTQFDALVEYDATTNRLTVLRNTATPWWWLQLLARIVLTVVVECLLVLPFRFPRRRWLPIPVNLATQGLLNVVVLAALPGLFQTHYAIAFAVLEAAILGIEFLAYFFGMAERRFWKPFLYAVLANGITLAVGLWWLS